MLTPFISSLRLQETFGLSVIAASNLGVVAISARSLGVEAVKLARAKFRNFEVGLLLMEIWK